MACVCRQIIKSAFSQMPRLNLNVEGLQSHAYFSLELSRCQYVENKSYQTTNYHCIFMFKCSSNTFSCQIWGENLYFKKFCIF